MVKMDTNCVTLGGHYLCHSTPNQGTEKNAKFLRVFGLSQQEIADLLGVTQPAVNEALSKRKKNRRAKTKHDNSKSTSG
jgi:CRP-like cAMP-binding protein